MFTPSAGFHKDCNRLQHACQVKKLIEETDPHGDNILFLVEEEGNQVWVIPNLKKKKAGTLKSYLTSFEIFLDYVSKKGKRRHLPVIDMEGKNQLFDLCNSLKWRRCITKEMTSAKWDRYPNELDHFLTNEEVQDILSPKPAVDDGRAALVAADQAEKMEDLSVTQYVDAHDFLIVTLTRAVGTRPATLENATLDMLKKSPLG